MDQKQGELETERSRKTSLGAMDAKGYKTVVHARIAEDRVRALEEELDKKVCKFDCSVRVIEEELGKKVCKLRKVCVAQK